MECREALELLNDEIDGRLAPGDAARLAAHVASCAACAKAKRELASLRDAFRAVPKDAAPADLRQAVMSSLPRGRLLKFPTMLGWIVAVAAVFVVAVTLIPRGGTVAERQVADATVRNEAKGLVAREAGPLPEPAAPPAATPVGPPRPGLAAEGDRAAGANAEGRVARRDAKSDDADAEKAGAAAKPAEAPIPAKEEKDRASADDATETSGAVAGPAAPAATVRYIVFRDAASAARFTESLAAYDALSRSDKAPDAVKTKPSAAPPAPPAAGAAAPSGGSGGGGGAPEGPMKKHVARGDPAPLGEQERRVSLLVAAQLSPRRVVARVPLPPGVADAELDRSITEAQGALVAEADTRKFANLLDEAAPSSGADAAKQAAPAPAPKPPADEKLAAKDRPARAADALADAAHAPVVLVIVVLEPPAGGKR